MLDDDVIGNLLVLNERELGIRRAVVWRISSAAYVRLVMRVGQQRDVILPDPEFGDSIEACRRRLLRLYSTMLEERN